MRSHGAAAPSHQVVVARTQALLASRASLARTFVTRARGLLGRAQLPDGEALVFPSSQSIHTWGMRFPIDVILVDRSWRVVSIREALAPWRILLPVRGAWGVIETAAGSIARVGLRVGDQLTLVRNGG